MWEAHYSSCNVWEATISVLFQGEENGLKLSRPWKWLSFTGAGCWHSVSWRGTELHETQATTQDPQPFTSGGYCRSGVPSRHGVLGPAGREPSRALWPPLTAQGCWMPNSGDVLPSWGRGLQHLRAPAGLTAPAYCRSSVSRILQEQRFPHSFCVHFK